MVNLIIVTKSHNPNYMNFFPFQSVTITSLIYLLCVQTARDVIFLDDLKQGLKLIIILLSHISIKKYQDLFLNLRDKG
ncbi:hypothetical protein BpHYR1_020375 [Brachionus plicatilis]|uniref:Uncharacterized protein n=1 Tax=Brachionus plicatilis TaxID=10195 RepID=A0A3M7R775_BRAPC|nr:hypothetical protein BpHYR1_020375 [Brachionus plicatilis]